MRKFFSKYCGLLASLALAFTIVTANSTCVYTLYQEFLIVSQIDLPKKK